MFFFWGEDKAISYHSSSMRSLSYCDKCLVSRSSTSSNPFQGCPATGPHKSLDAGILSPLLPGACCASKSLACLSPLSREFWFPPLSPSPSFSGQSFQPPSSFCRLPGCMRRQSKHSCCPPIHPHYLHKLGTYKQEGVSLFQGLGYSIVSSF